jgi:hypothetical protein
MIGCVFLNREKKLSKINLLGVGVWLGVVTKTPAVNGFLVPVKSSNYKSDFIIT